MKPHHEKFVSGPSLVPTMNVSKRMKIGAWDFQSGAGAYYASSDASLFSSSVPVLPHEKLMISDRDQGHESTDNAAGNFDKNHQKIDDSFENIAEQTMRFLLPDNEEELLADLIDYGLRNMPSQLESEDTDLFDSLGGMELETDAQESLGMGMSKLNLADGAVGNGEIQYGQLNSVGNVVGEHPYGEHPSRTLFVRNINSNVEDLELKNLFEQFGDVRALYTTCKHRGFVMISYYDIRDARVAMRALQNKPLRRRKLDIHFSIPKDNPSEKDLNQGTLVVFNLDPSVSNEDLFQIFGAYGEVKEIRETPHKRHHKFIEFYDVRAAEAALRALNRSDLAGKRIKLEPSRPGGTRRPKSMEMENERRTPDEKMKSLSIDNSQSEQPPSSNSSPAEMIVEEKFRIVRSIGEECIQDDELRKLLADKPEPICYDGFEPSGRMHIAQGVLKAINVNKLTSAGCRVKIWIADWFAQLNGKMGGDLKKIEVVGQYFIEIWKSVGMNLDEGKVEFLWSSKEINSRAHEYWPLVMDIARRNKVPRIIRCCTIMGRNEDDLTAAQIMYPCMQCADIFFLKADICQMGTDQRKVNMLAREYCDDVKRKRKPIILSHHMLPGLQQGQEKMSKSDPSSSIYMEDEEADVNVKIKKAYCPPKLVEGNPCLEYIEYLVFPWFHEFKVARSPDHGGEKIYKSFEELAADYEAGDLHPGDVKPALSKALNTILQPVRNHFASDSKAKDLLKRVKAYRVTK